MKILSYTVLAEEDGIILKNWLRLHGISTRSTVRLKYYGDILQNGTHATVRAVLHGGDRIELKFPDDEQPAHAEKISVPVLYEDDSLLVMMKPPHMPVHPSKDLQSGTLANAFAAHMNRRGLRLAFRAVNRLDRGTSGLVVAALDPVAASKLNGAVDKEYICVCIGELPENGVIDRPIRRRDGSKMERCVADDGKPAITNYKRIFTNGKYSVARVRLETGRTHQIRVHFSSIGHPLVGDTMYGFGDNLLDRQALHCASLELIHPMTGKRVRVKAPLPDDIKNWLSDHEIDADV